MKEFRSSRLRVWENISRTMQEFKVLLLGYRSYTALLTQTGTDAPVVTVLENTIGNIWFEYSNTGSFIINSNGLFNDANKIILLGSFFGDTNGTTSNGAGYVFNYIVASPNQIILNVYDLQYTPVSVIGGDGRLCPIEIRVYN